MTTTTQMTTWLDEVKGLRVQHNATGEVMTITDARQVGSEWYIGLLPIGGPVVYTNAHTYVDCFTSIA